MADWTKHLPGQCHWNLSEVHSGSKHHLLIALVVELVPILMLKPQDALCWLAQACSGPPHHPFSTPFPGLAKELNSLLEFHTLWHQSEHLWRKTRKTFGNAQSINYTVYHVPSIWRGHMEKNGRKRDMVLAYNLVTRQTLSWDGNCMFSLKTANS